MADDITPSQVPNAEYTAGVQLEMFPFWVFMFLVVYVFGARFHYNTFLVSNRGIG